MPSAEFYFRHFVVRQDKCAMKIGTDSMLLGAVAKPGNARMVLDIGTGSGVLALMLAQRTAKGTHIDAIEINEDAFPQTCENIRNSIWHYRMMAYHTSLQEFRPKAVGLYGLIVCNPPYFDDNLQMASGSRKLARANSHLSYNDLCSHVARLLKDEGRFTLILPAGATDAFIQVADRHGLYLQEALNISNYRGSELIRRILTLGFEQREPAISELAIFESTGKYSREYKDLTKSYYAREV